MASFSMVRWRILSLTMSLVHVGWATSELQATLIINPPLPITHQVKVQIIQTALDNGSQSATIMGNSLQTVEVQSAIDTIWAQAGVDIQFESTISRFDDTFAFQGNGGIRPVFDLNIMLVDAGAEGDILSSLITTLNMFFVEVVPGFDFTGESHATGIAKIGVNGIAIFVGEGLIATANGTDLVASIISHEIGHNMGLFHTTGSPATLMSSGASSQVLTQQQINTVLASPFPRPLPTPADLDGNGVVDGEDVAQWESSFGIGNNGDVDGDGDSDGADFLALQRQLSISSGIRVSTVVSPEPTTLALAAVAITTLLITRHRPAATNLPCESGGGIARKSG